MQPRLKRGYFFGQKAQGWDAFFLFFVATVILFSLSYFFIYKFGGVPTVKPKREIGPAERGVLPEGTLFPARPKKKKNNQPFQNLRPLQNRRSYLFFKPVLAAVTLSANNKSTPIKKPVLSVPVLETYLTVNFSPNATLQTDTVAFKLSGKNLTNPKERVGFEVLLFPLEKNWMRVSGNRTYVNLKRGGYIFFVRARNSQGIIDRTPAFIPFQIRISDAYKKIYLSYDLRGKQLTFTNFSRQPFNLTNWKISSFAGDFTIPQAVKFVEYFFDGLRQDIILQPGERLVLTTNDSAIGLDAFKLNRCFRFLSRAYKFDFSAGGCKNFSRDELFRLRRYQALSDRCVNFIQSHACVYPTDKELKTIQAEYGCYKFVWDNLTYRGCVENNRAKPDFLAKEWRVYIPTTRFNYSRFDEIRVTDQLGFLVTSKKIYWDSTILLSEHR